MKCLMLDPKTRLQLCCFGLSKPENIKEPWQLHNAGRGIVGNKRDPKEEKKKDDLCPERVKASVQRIRNAG